MSYLDIENGQIYFEDHAGPKAYSDTMLLVHGWGMSVRCWDPILPALHNLGLRVVSFDHRGCGKSDKDFTDVSIDAIANDTVALLAHLNISRVVLNGWSLGGAVAVAAAAKLEAKCVGLILTGGATPVYTQKADFPHGGTAEDMAGTLEAYQTNRVDFLQGLSQIVCIKDVGASIENWFYRIFLEASPFAGATLGELADLDQRDLLLGLNLPIASIYGSEDGFVAPAICRWVGENHPTATNYEFTGVGHAPFIEAREDYLASLAAFVGEIA